MLRRILTTCRRLLAAPFRRWRRGPDRPLPPGTAAHAYEILSADPEADARGQTLEQDFQRRALDTLAARVGPGHLLLVPMLMHLSHTERSALKRRSLRRRALMLARGHCGWHHPLSLFIAGQQEPPENQGRR
jgi:hypothetical protein